MPDSPNQDKQFLNRLQEIIEANLSDEHFGVNELARELGKSRSYIHRKLKLLTNESMSSFICKLRLKKALELLNKKELTVSEIAYKVGFNSPSYFNKVFRKHFHISPGEVRKGNKVLVPEGSMKKDVRLVKLKTPVLVVSIVLIAIVLTVSGIHIFNGKEPSKAQSIAILPFDNLSSIENTQFFADGIVEDLLTRLSTIDDLKVISRTSSEMFRNKGDKTIPEIGKILGVGYILEGTVQRDAEDIRISIQLIDAENDDHVISKQYDRTLSELFEVQREIARKIASEIIPVITDKELGKLDHDYTHNPKALEHYQRGRFYSNKRTTENFKRGIECYEKAIVEDPNFALAYAGLADNYHLMAIQGRMDKTEANKLSLEMVKKALEINPDLAEAYTVLAGYYLWVEKNYETAEKEFKKALELNSNYSTAHQYYAEYLKIMGRDDEALEHIDKAVQLDPFSYIIRFYSSRTYYDQEQFDKALEDIKICLEMDSKSVRAKNLEYDIFLAMRNDTAVLNSLKEIFPEQVLDSIYQTGGLEAITKFQLESLPSNVPEYRKAIWYAMAGEYENAMNSLDMAMEIGRLSIYPLTYREYKPLRSNPRFIAIRKEMGLPPLEP